MNNSEMELLIMQLIMNSGNAKSLAMEAIKCAREGEFENAKIKISDAEDAINIAHESQSKLLAKEANGENFHFSLLLTHSQDHMMNTITTIDLAREIINLWKERKEGEVK